MEIEKTIPLAAGIVSSFVSNSHISPSEIPKLLADTHAAVVALATGQSSTPATASAPTPKTAAEIRKSITPDGIVSFEDGKTYKTMRRHLTTRGLTPEQYRLKWGLPPDYPIVAANYSAARASLAKAAGLGQRGAPSASDKPA